MTKTATLISEAAQSTIATIMKVIKLFQWIACNKQLQVYFLHLLLIQIFFSKKIIYRIKSVFNVKKLYKVGRTEEKKKIYSNTQVRIL